MQKTLVIAGWSLLSAAVAGVALGAPPVASNTAKPAPGTATAGPPKKPDAKQIAAIVEQGMAALDAEDFKLARDTFLDAVQVDPRNAKALHGLGLAYFKLKDLPKATAAIDKAVMVPGALDHPLAMNAGTIHLAAKAPMRAAKIARDYLTAKPLPADEPLANVLAVALDQADDRARKNAFYDNTRNFYNGYVKKMEAANPGFMRWGAQWLPAATVQEYNRANATHQPVVDKATRELADLDKQLGRLRGQLAGLMQKIERGYVLPEAAWPVQDEIRMQEDRRTEIKNRLDQATAQLVKPAPLPEMTALVAIDAPVPPLSKAVQPPAVALNEPRTPDSGPFDGSGSRSRRFRRPPSDNIGPGDGAVPGRDPAGDPTGASPNGTPPEPPPAAEEPATTPPAEEPVTPPPAPRKRIRLTTYAAAFAVAHDLVVTSAATVDGAGEIQLQARDGHSIEGEVVRTDAASGLALVRVKGVKLAFLDLGAPQAGKVTCAAFAQANIFAPQAEILTGTAPAPAASWVINFPRHPRLPGAPLIQNGKVVGVAVGDRDSDKAAYPAIPVDAVRTLIGNDAAKPAGNNPDPLYAVLQVSAMKEREQ